jgi:hypothetical protein
MTVRRCIIELIIPLASSIFHLPCTSRIFHLPRTSLIFHEQRTCSNQRTNNEPALNFLNYCSFYLFSDLFQPKSTLRPLLTVRDLRTVFIYFLRKSTLTVQDLRKKANFLRSSSFQKFSSEKRGQLSQKSTSEKVVF